MLNPKYNNLICFGSVIAFKVLDFFFFFTTFRTQHFVKQFTFLHIRFYPNYFNYISGKALLLNHDQYLHFRFHHNFFVSHFKFLLPSGLWQHHKNSVFVFSNKSQSSSKIFLAIQQRICNVSGITLVFFWLEKNGLLQPSSVSTVPGLP